MELRGSLQPLPRALDNFSPGGDNATISSSPWDTLISEVHVETPGTISFLEALSAGFGEGKLPPSPHPRPCLPAGQRWGQPSMAHCSWLSSHGGRWGAEPGPPTPPGRERRAAPPPSRLQRPGGTNPCHCGASSLGAVGGWGDSCPQSSIQQDRKSVV